MSEDDKHRMPGQQMSTTAIMVSVAVLTLFFIVVALFFW